VAVQAGRRAKFSSRFFIPMLTQKNNSQHRIRGSGKQRSMEEQTCTCTLASMKYRVVACCRQWYEYTIQGTMHKLAPARSLFLNDSTAVNATALQRHHSLSRRGSAFHHLGTHSSSPLFSLFARQHHDTPSAGVCKAPSSNLHHHVRDVNTVRKLAVEDAVLMSRTGTSNNSGE